MNLEDFSSIIINFDYLYRNSTISLSLFLKPLVLELCLPFPSKYGHKRKILLFQYLNHPMKSAKIHRLFFFFYIKENGRSLNLRPCNFYFNFGCVLGYIWPHVSLSLIIDSDKHEWADKSKYYLYIWFFLVLKILSTWLIQQSAYKTKNSPFKK